MSDGLTLECIRRRSQACAAGEPSGEGGMRVHVLVGAARPDVEAQLYECPLYLLQTAATALREVLGDLVEAALSEGLDTAGATLPLPHLDPSVFEVIALYMEHFYAVTYEPHRARASVSSAVEVPRGPTPLSAPLVIQELYALQAWERRFTLERLVALPGVLERRGEACTEATYTAWDCQGAWVDALGGSGSLSLSEEERRGVVQRVSRVLEGARRMGVEGLTSLCGALVANVLVDVNDGRLKHLFKGKSGSVPDCSTPERRRELLEQFPEVSVD